MKKKIIFTWQYTTGQYITGHLANQEDIQAEIYAIHCISCTLGATEV
jgi:hypothetical protein